MKVVSLEVTRKAIILMGLVITKQVSLEEFQKQMNAFPPEVAAIVDRALTLILLSKLSQMSPQLIEEIIKEIATEKAEE